jgi:hypothetical protein
MVAGTPVSDGMFVAYRLGIPTDISCTVFTVLAGVNQAAAAVADAAVQVYSAAVSASAPRMCTIHVLTVVLIPCLIQPLRHLPRRPP